MAIRWCVRVLTGGQVKVFEYQAKMQNVRNQVDNLIQRALADEPALLENGVLYAQLAPLLDVIAQEGVAHDRFYLHKKMGDMFFGFQKKSGTRLIDCRHLLAWSLESLLSRVEGRPVRMGAIGIDSVLLTQIIRDNRFNNMPGLIRNNLHALRDEDFAYAMNYPSREHLLDVLTCISASEGPHAERAKALILKFAPDRLKAAS
jgi:hypothetical protein